MVIHVLKENKAGKLDGKSRVGNEGCRLTGVAQEGFRMSDILQRADINS